MSTIKAHKCTLCDYIYTEEEGGVQGDFGIMPVAFCPRCYKSTVDMVHQLEGEYISDIISTQIGDDEDEQ